MSQAKFQKGDVVVLMSEEYYEDNGPPAMVVECPGFDTKCVWWYNGEFHRGDFDEAVLKNVEE